MSVLLTKAQEKLDEFTVKLNNRESYSAKKMQETQKGVRDIRTMLRNTFYKLEPASEYHPVARQTGVILHEIDKTLREMRKVCVAY